MSGEEKALSVERLLRQHGLGAVRVSAAGRQGEIAVLSVADDDAWSELVLDGGDLAREVKALGFRYVSVALAEATAPGAEP